MISLASAVTLVVVVAVGICFEALDVNRRGVLEFSEFEKANTDYIIADDTTHYHDCARVQRVREGSNKADDVTADIADDITNGTTDGMR